MPFTRVHSIDPLSRGAISIVFHIPDPDDDDDIQYGRLGVQIKYSDDTVTEHSFDLLARLGDDFPGQTHLVNLAALKDYILNRIETELLP